MSKLKHSPTLAKVIARQRGVAYEPPEYMVEELKDSAVLTKVIAKERKTPYEPLEHIVEDCNNNYCRKSNCVLNKKLKRASKEKLATKEELDELKTVDFKICQYPRCEMTEWGYDKSKNLIKGYCGLHYMRARRAGALGLSTEELIEKQHDSSLWSHHRIRLSDARTMWDKQEHRCSCCFVVGPDVYTPCREWVIDHNRLCCPTSLRRECGGKCTRGIICSMCNKNNTVVLQDRNYWLTIGNYLGHIDLKTQENWYKDQIAEGNIDGLG